ncbi:MAG: hypothetical protein ACK4K7_01210 [Allosphingosinicella sp.]|uniref:hypothetical protein n=1 Tax=Allosphingosinicella sp. TaxID=2823234 RepID=UPI00395CC361
MRNNIAAAVFRDSDQAERAIRELREAGVPDDAISTIRLHDGTTETRDGAGHRTEVHDHGDNKATGAAKGLAAGGVLGAIAGIGALAIPGIGPFIAGGALAQTLGAAGSAAVVSGALGAAAGGLTGALVDYGLDREHAEYYEKEVKAGGIFVAVDTSSDPSAYAASRAVLRAAGGQSADAGAESHA